WIFTRTFRNASPTRVARDVQHRRKRPTHASVVGFLRSYGSRTFRQSRIPTTCFSKRNGEDRAIAVDHVEAKQNRNLQTRLVHRNALHLIRALRAANVES